MKRTLTLVLFSISSFCFVIPAGANNRGALSMTAQLVSPISSRINQKGDKVSAIVTSPDAFRGAPLEGVIEEAKSSGDVKKTSSLRFAFKTLTYQGKTIPVTADIVSFSNSKGQKGVDEEGRVVKKSSGFGKVAASAAIGAGIGALISGAKGAAAGAGVGFAVGFVFVSVAVKGPDIQFDTNAIFEVAVRECPSCGDPRLGRREFNNGSFTFLYPNDWQVYRDGTSPNMTMAPAFGVVPGRVGRVEIGFGAIAGIYSPDLAAGGLAGATDSLIRVLKTNSRNLEVLPGSTPPGPGENQIYVVALASDSSLEQGRDFHLLVTMMRPEGLFYFMGLAPAARYQEVRNFTAEILGTLRFRQ